MKSLLTTFLITAVLAANALGQTASLRKSIVLKNPGPDRITLFLKPSDDSRKWSSYPVEPGAEFTITGITPGLYDVVVQYKVGGYRKIEYGKAGFNLAEALEWKIPGAPKSLQLPLWADLARVLTRDRDGRQRTVWVRQEPRGDCAAMIDCKVVGSQSVQCTLQPQQAIASNCRPAEYPLPDPIPEEPEEEDAADGSEGDDNEQAKLSRKDSRNNRSGSMSPGGLSG